MGPTPYLRPLTSFPNSVAEHRVICGVGGGGGEVRLFDTVQEDFETFKTGVFCGIWDILSASS